MWTLAFWKQAADRAIKSAAQAVILAWGLGDQIANLFTLDWKSALGAAGGGALLSVLTSLISAPFGEKDSPQLIQ